VGEPAGQPLLVGVEGDPGRHLRELRHCRVQADVVARRTVPDRQPLVSRPRGADGEWQQVVTAVARVELDEPPRVGGHGRETGIDGRRARFGERAEHPGQLVGSEVECLGEASPVPRPRRRRSLLPAGDGRPLDAQPLGQALLGQSEGLPPGSEALTSGHLVLVGRCLSPDRRSSVVTGTMSTRCGSVSPMPSTPRSAAGPSCRAVATHETGISRRPASTSPPGCPRRSAGRSRRRRRRPAPGPAWPAGSRRSRPGSATWAG
jgi:hypothetical protein